MSLIGNLAGDCVPSTELEWIINIKISCTSLRASIYFTAIKQN